MMVFKHWMRIMIKLKSYQEDAIEAIKDGFNRHQRQYIEMPTGSGKTITFLHYAYHNSSKALVLVPSIQLMHQVQISASNFYEDEEVSIKGGGINEAYEPTKLHICVVASLRGDYLDYINQADFDLIIIDEAHHSQSKIYQRYLKDKKCKVLGVTATPDRSDGLFLTSILEKQTFKLSIAEMIENQHLSDIEAFSIKTHIDLSDVDDHNGDFSINLLFKKLCTKSRNDMILEIYKDKLIDRKTLVFCINIAHSKILTKLFEENGISAAHIDGSMNEGRKSEILRLFRNGNIKVLFNCNILTEGFDEPSIDGMILARPTSSKTLFIQMVGRGLRLYPGKNNCRIIDVCDNHKALANFGNLIPSYSGPPIDFMHSFGDLKKQAKQNELKILEYSIERAQLFSNDAMEKVEATHSMIEYLDSHGVRHYKPISFDEASFLIWYNELKREYYGYNSKK